MKSFKVKIPEGYEVDKEESTFENIVFKKKIPEYPTSVKEIEGRYWYSTNTGCIVHCDDHNDINQVSSKERAQAFLALMQLVELRDACNEKDGGKEWTNGEYNYIIEVYDNKISKDSWEYSNSVLHFRKKSTRDWFFKEHEELIEQAKELI